MALSDDLLLQRRNNQGLTRQLLNQSANLPKPSPEQLQQWNNEAKNYAYQADGLRGSFRKLLGMNPYTNNYPSASRIGTEIASIPPVQSSSTRQLSDFEALGKNAVSPIPRTASSSVQNGEPTSIQGVTKQLINGVPTYSNAPNQDASGLGIIPSIRQNSPSVRDILQSAATQIPAYNAGTQSTVIEDSTTGGYYQRRKADRANKKTIDRLNSQGKDNWQINKQAALDNSQLQNDSLSRRLLGSNIEAAERVGSLERLLADFNATPQQRLAALQTRNLLASGAQKAQRNAVNVVTDELPDGSKKQRVIVTDPSTGQEVSNIDWASANTEDYINEIAKRTGKSKEEIHKQLISGT
ncbi:hypothetical protein MTZ49_07125 [Entomomonas sp. E2T0]|uniref:hypothetical protein n=1 Tax=Entomomonas sp. E2T0 TaxID=2930213 RepID=UPI0022284A93|nr:hypothetical protein [Entomomonas sp. E2T0]UYZ85310.1 hypothetical protein MTZ49_07125 [Entomomonas sp. E2T0]